MIKFITLAVLLATTVPAMADNKCAGTINNAKLVGVVGTYSQPDEKVLASATSLAAHLDSFTVEVTTINNGCIQIEVVKK